ncbi:hypothetical protein DFO62_103402 [Serratia fonticola]|nr:hypothetical protein DFO62_103402 [Serratia fonticola]
MGKQNDDTYSMLLLPPPKKERDEFGSVVRICGMLPLAIACKKTAFFN